MTMRNLLRSISNVLKPSWKILNHICEILNTKRFNIEQKTT